MVKISPVKKDYEKIINSLEEELVRKQERIEALECENKLLLKTAIKARKHSQR
ncbi:MAG: hypothetical protein KKF89_06135 [Nanoarchaeota archaeon]|nr:hypothetical protein [Nanoarchaeota archaeon]MBU1855278.1 hypothetical protein [Nanoarchaeota archaeon]